MTTESVQEKINQFEIEEAEAVKTFRAQDGKVAATFCRFFPTSLLAGLGLRSIRILTGANISAESAGERMVRSDVCSYCKTILGNFLEQTSLHSQVDLVIGVITCDQMRRTLERLQFDLKIPVFPIQVPATRTSASELYFLNSVKRIISDLGHYLEHDFDLHAVRKEEETRRAAATILLHLSQTGTVAPIVLQKLNRLFATARSAELLTFLERHIDELPAHHPKRKLVLVGSVCSDGDDLLFEILSEHHIGIVPLNCTGLHALEGYARDQPLPEDKLVEYLARTIFQSNPCIRHRPNNLVYDKIAETLKKSQASGIILKTLPFCDLWYTEKERMRATFAVPLLVLDSGYGEGIQDRLRSRIDAFLETLPC